MGGLLLHRPADKLPRWGSTPLRGPFPWGAAQPLSLAARSAGMGCVVSLTPLCPKWQRPLPAQQKPLLPRERGRAMAAECAASEGLRKPNLPQEI